MYPVIDNGGSEPVLRMNELLSYHSEFPQQSAGSNK